MSRQTITKLAGKLTKYVAWEEDSHRKKPVREKNILQKSTANTRCRIINRSCLHSLLLITLALLAAPSHAAPIASGDTPATVYRVSTINSGVWWEYSFHGNDFPLETSSGWMKFSSGAPSDFIIANAGSNYYRISTHPGDRLYYIWQGVPNLPDREGGYTAGFFRPDTWGGATIDSRVRINAMNAGASAVQLIAFNTTTRLFGIQFTPTTIQWIDGTPITNLPSNFNPTNFNSYRFVYVNSPSPQITLYINNSPVPIATSQGVPKTGTSNIILWGDTTTQGGLGGEADWDFVRFAKNAHTPTEHTALVSKRYLTSGGVVVTVDVSCSEIVKFGDIVHNTITAVPQGTVVMDWSDTIYDRFESMESLVDMSNQQTGTYLLTSRLIDGVTSQLLETMYVNFIKPQTPPWASQ